jgi:hypothetical protein
MPYDLLLPPVVGAVIGWLTNYVAIKLLFRPHVPFSLLGYQVQGVIPKRRKEIARSMARTFPRTTSQKPFRASNGKKRSKRLSKRPWSTGSPRGF